MKPSKNAKKDRWWGEGADGTDYATFQKVLRKLRLPRDIYGELAVLLNELKAPIIGVAEILDRICKTKKCSRSEFVRLLELIAYQWQFHAEDLDLLMRKLDGTRHWPRKTQVSSKSKRSRHQSKPQKTAQKRFRSAS